MIRRLFLALVIVLAPVATAAETHRSRAALAEFKRAHPCPATGLAQERCPGYEIDHIQPLCARGLDEPGNMQWLTIEEHRKKTRRDLAGCMGRVYTPKPATGKPVAL